MKKNRKRAVAISGCVVIMLGLLTACLKEDASIKPQDAKDGNLLGAVATDKARYMPGDKVQYTLAFNDKDEKSDVLVRYMHFDQVVEEKKLKWDGESALTWEWEAPQDDYTGYMTEIYVKQGSELVDHANIAVDVSSDWAKFPRYGYLADFMAMEQADRETIIERLNRFHINGIQFYDWQWKHHIPLMMDGAQPAESWPDIANRPVSFETVKSYIDLAHGKNMKAMNYNLLFGAYEDAWEDGVKPEWGAYKDPLHTDLDKHHLPDSWASDILLMDPSNPEWQQYLFEKEKVVYDHLPFDGWHVDQLGDRGSLWNYDSKKIDLAASYAPFLQEAKKAIDVDYVINAVGQYGQAWIAKSAPVEFLYTEVWSGHSHYKQLKDIIDQNWGYSKGKLNTVLAAYMNYDHANAQGEFNAPGVLLTNAVIFAAGGSHLEMGENMLAKEYFPNRNLTIPADLEKALIRYYDFLTAYQNLLRDGVTEAEVTVASDTIELASTAEQGKVWAMTKEKDGKHVLQFLNFANAAHMNWNDSDANQLEPELIENLDVTVDTERKVERVWTASPDRYEGSAIELDFEQKDGKLTFDLPQLKYWDMVVVEYADRK